MAPSDLIELLEVLVRALTAAGIDYVVGGALALGMWAETRGTRDIDVTVYVPPERVETVFSLLEGLGGVVERDLCRWQLATAGYFAAEFDLFRIDVFLPTSELHDWALTRRVSFRVGASDVWFLSAEDTLVFKLVFFRGKDKLDIESLVRVQHQALDLHYIRKALSEIVRDEERSVWFEGLVRGVFAVRGNPPDNPG